MDEKSLFLFHFPFPNVLYYYLPHSFKFQVNDPFFEDISLLASQLMLSFALIQFCISTSYLISLYSLVKKFSHIRNFFTGFIKFSFQNKVAECRAEIKSYK